MNDNKELKWTKKFSIGNEKLDDDHKELFQYYAEMLEIVNSDSNNELFVDILTKMTTYADKHFSEEEEYMKSFGYPKLEEHKAIHLKFYSDVVKFNLNFFRLNSTKPKDVLVFLRNWLINHILVIDKEYLEYKKKLDNK